MQDMVESDEWDEWARFKRDYTEAAEVCKESILDDNHWAVVKTVLHFTSPLLHVLRLADAQVSEGLFSRCCTWGADEVWQ